MTDAKRKSSKRDGEKEKLAGIVFVPYVPKGNKANIRNIWCELGKKRTVFISKKVERAIILPF